MSLAYKNRKKAIKRGEWRFDSTKQPTYQPNVMKPTKWLIRIIKDKLGCNNLDARIQLGIQTVKDLAIKRQMIKRLQGII